MEFFPSLPSTPLPGRCLLCEQATPRVQRLCSGCYADLPVIGAGCFRCGIPLAKDGLCGNCLSNPGSVDRTISHYLYSYPVNHLIHDLKYRAKLIVTPALCPGIVQRITASAGPLPQILLPVPLHPYRLYRRGFNQAALIAENLSRALAIPVDNRLLVRRRATREQYALPVGQRRRNVKGAFTLANKPVYESVALIDDVITTGNTINELGRILRRNGVLHIEAWSLARTADPG